MKPEDLLDQVHDKNSFIAFVEALAAEREEAQALEKAEPKRYCIDGAHNWKNADIVSFLSAALSYFDEKPFHKPEETPSWRMFADFLFCGKIYE